MKKTEAFYLSYLINENTPMYGGHKNFQKSFLNDMSKGDSCDHSFFHLSAHTGTHIDFPNHFYPQAQSFSSFPPDFWTFYKPLILDINDDSPLIKDSLIDQLSKVSECDYDILIVKTGQCFLRTTDIYWQANKGFHPEVASYIRKKFPHIRVFGFDSISVSSFLDRPTGRLAHKEFLHPDHPILLLEDMDLRFISSSDKVEKILVAPLPIEAADGAPCLVIAYTYRCC